MTLETTASALAKSEHQQKASAGIQAARSDTHMSKMQWEYSPWKIERNFLNHG